MLAALIGCTLPGSSVRATTVSAVTVSPFLTTTSPFSGQAADLEDLRPFGDPEPGRVGVRHASLPSPIAADGRVGRPLAGSPSGRRPGRRTTRSASRSAPAGSFGSANGWPAAAVEDDPDHAAAQGDLAAPSPCPRRRRSRTPARASPPPSRRRRAGSRRIAPNGTSNSSSCRPEGVDRRLQAPLPFLAGARPARRRCRGGSGSPGRRPRSPPCGLVVRRVGQHAELRHHEDRVDRQLGDALGQEGVDHHQRRLDAARRVREHAAGADEQVEVVAG